MSDWLDGPLCEVCSHITREHPTLGMMCPNCLEQEEAQDHDKEQRPRGETPSEEKKSPAAILVDLLQDAPRFHNTKHETFVTFEDGRTVRTRSGYLRRWLSGAFWRITGNAPSGQAMQSAIGVIEGQALFDGEERDVPVRVFNGNDRILLDLGDETQQVVEVTSAGWRVADPDDADVTFLRTAGLLPLPEPESGGSLDLLRTHLNVAGNEDFILIAAWPVAALRLGRPAPVLVLTGEQGSAKSTVQRMLRSLVDPNSAPLRPAPRSERDLAIAASNAHIQSFDNFSKLTPALSDALCRLATGGGFATRTLYTDQEETLFDSMRPIIANGIANFVTRGDLLDRSIIVSLPVIPTAERKPERRVWEDFERDRPRIIGAILSAVSVGLGNVEHMRLAEAPRMADFAEWIAACSPALPFTAREFIGAYEANRAEGVAQMLADDVVGSLLAQIEMFEGTAGELLELIRRDIGGDGRKERLLPKSPQGMGWAIRRLAPALRQSGMMVEFLGHQGQSRARTILISGGSCAGEHRSDRTDRFAGMPTGARKVNEEYEANDVARDTSLADAGEEEEMLL